MMGNSFCWVSLSPFVPRSSSFSVLLPHLSCKAHTKSGHSPVDVSVRYIYTTLTWSITLPLVSHIIWELVLTKEGCNGSLLFSFIFSEKSMHFDVRQMRVWILYSISCLNVWPSWGLSFLICEIRIIPHQIVRIKFD